MTVPSSPVSASEDPPASVSRSRQRLLILGGTGMLGHQLYHAARARFETWVTVRQDAAAGHPLFPEPPRVITGVDATRPDSYADAIARLQPHAIINAVGLIKQRSDGGDPVEAIQINALFPHQLGRCA